MKKESQATLNFRRIAEAIAFIHENFKSQPTLEEVAGHIHVSPEHFQRMFTEWAGVSPKKFLQFISVEYAKTRLKQQGSTLFEATAAAGLSSTSRLHDLFVKIEGMTPATYKNGGKNLLIEYSFAESPFGQLLVASTSKGVCHMAFVDDPNQALQNLESKFPHATFRQEVTAYQQNALSVFEKQPGQLEAVKLHLRGTDFQLKVWQSLLKVGQGKLVTYGNIAREIGHPAASRAVGTAIGRNPVAFLIPCHRVIQATGVFGGYMWGSIRKTAMIGWEGAQEQRHEDYKTSI